MLYSTVGEASGFECNGLSFMVIFAKFVEWDGFFSVIFLPYDRLSSIQLCLTSTPLGFFLAGSKANISLPNSVCQLLKICQAVLRDGIFHMNHRLHTTNVVWNPGLAWTIPWLAVLSPRWLGPGSDTYISANHVHKVWWRSTLHALCLLWSDRWFCQVLTIYMKLFVDKKTMIGPVYKSASESFDWLPRRNLIVVKAMVPFNETIPKTIIYHGQPWTTMVDHEIP